MKVRHVVLTDAFAGVERHVCVLANAQARLGHQVEVLGGKPQAMRSLLAPTVDYRAARSVLPTALQATRGPSPDVLHAHMTKAEAACLLPALVGGVPLIATRHFAGQRGRRRGGWIARGLIGRTVDAQIAISHYVAAAVDGDSTVVYPGVEAATQDRYVRRPVVLVVQRLQPEKATEVALRAFAVGAPAGWSLEVVGEGPERAELEQLVSRLGVASRVRFLGFRDDVPELMLQSSMLVSPCKIEGLGLSVLEAMAHGLPVVASRAGAHPETVGLSADAQLFQPGDVGEAALMIERLCRDAELRSRYGRELQQVQQQRFTPEAQARATDAVYDEVRR